MDITTFALVTVGAAGLGALMYLSTLSRLYNHISIGTINKRKVFLFFTWHSVLTLQKDAVRFGILGAANIAPNALVSFILRLVLV